MKDFIRGRTRRSIVIFFLTIYAVTLLFALFPPLYLAGSGIRTPVLGIPFSIMYWVLDWAVLGLGLWGFYHVENIRGELDEGHPATPPHLTGE
jgi:TRAP-type C4-dicarboxylate transport system permease small subunit